MRARCSAGSVQVTGFLLTAAAGPWAAGQITAEPGWPRATGFSVSPSATAAQMDDDAQLEVVIASQDNRVYVYNHDGSLLPGWPRFMGDTLWPDPWVHCNSSPATADLDGDGRDEIIVGGTDGKVYVLRRDGTNFPGWPRAVAFMVFSSPAVGNIDADPQLEIVVGDNQGWVYAFNADGTACTGFPFQTPYTIHASPALGDLDEDGIDDIVIASESSSPDLFAFKGTTGAALPGWPRDIDPNVGLISSPTMGDIDLDGHLDVVIGLRAGMIAALDRFGNAKPGWPQTVGYSCASSPTLANLDGDPELELVVGFNDSQVVAYNHDGTKLAGWPVATSYTVISSPSVADIDGDGRVEIVVGENTGKVYAFETTGQAVTGFPITAPTYTVYSSPLLSDLDRDGHTELVVGCNDSSVYAFDLGAGTYDAELRPWPEFRGDARNTGRLARPAYMRLTVAPTARVDGSVDVSMIARSISLTSSSFQLWFRVFTDTGLATGWPMPPVEAINLGAMQGWSLTSTLDIPATLPPGRYHLQAYFGTRSVRAFDVARATIDILPACPADVNGDGIVEFTDYLEFLTRYDFGDLRVDFNKDGIVDFSDYLEFLTSYDGGCAS